MQYLPRPVRVHGLVTVAPSAHRIATSAASYSHAGKDLKWDSEWYQVSVCDSEWYQVQCVRQRVVSSEVRTIYTRDVAHRTAPQRTMCSVQCAAYNVHTLYSYTILIHYTHTLYTVHYTVQCAHMVCAGNRRYASLNLTC
jgi:hypothetical protein